MKLKKLLASILCVAMVLSTMSFTAFAAGDTDEANAVASIGDQYYSTVALAMADAQENDTIVIHKEINETAALTAPTVAPLTFKAATDGIKITGRAYLPKTDIAGVVTYDGFDFTDNTDWTVQQWDGNEKLNNLELVYKNCKFGTKGICISWHQDKPNWNLKKITLDNCTAADAKEVFSLQYVDEVVIENCDFSNSTQRLINVSAASGDVTVDECNFGAGSIQLSQNVGDEARDLTVTNSTFTGEKAIVIHENLTNNSTTLENITVTNNTVAEETEVVNFKDDTVKAIDYLENTNVTFSENKTSENTVIKEISNGFEVVNGEIIPAFALNRVEAENAMKEDDLSAQSILITFNNVPCIDENMTVQLYHDDELLSTTNATAKRLGQAYSALTANVVYSGDAAISGSWTTEINAPWTIDRAPNKIVVDIDGIETTFTNFEIAAFSKFEKFDLTAGSITVGYTNNTSVWGEGGANAKESFVVELYAEEEKIGQASLNDYEDIIDGDLYVTWNINFAGEDSEYWTVDWYGNNPSVDTVPTKVVLLADGVKVAENIVKMCAPDDLNPVKWDELEGVSAAARIGKKGYSSVKAAIADAEAQGLTNVEIEVFVDFLLSDIVLKNNSSITDLTITGNGDVTMDVEDKLYGLNNKNYVLNNLTVSGMTRWQGDVYFADMGLQSGNVTFNDCTLNGLYTLYQGKFVFDGCVINGETNKYSMMIYASKDVTFTDCVFNSDNKAIKVFGYGTFLENAQVNISGTKFYASATENVKAVVEMDLTQQTNPAVDLTIEDSFALGFAEGSETGNVWYNVELPAGKTDENISSVVTDSTAYQCGDITVAFENATDADGKEIAGLYNIVLNAADGADIYEFVSAELTFANTSKTVAIEDMNYEILGISGTTNAEKSIEKADTYALRLVDGAERMTGSKLVIGQVKFYGQGDINFTVSMGKVVITEYGTNLGRYYTLDANDTTDDTLKVDAITNNKVEEVTRTVVVNVAYNHALDGTYWNDNQITVTLKDGFGNVYDAVDLTNGVATINNVKLGRLTVTLEAPGFRKYVYNTTLEAGADANDALVLNFWNNVKRNEELNGVVVEPLAEIETGKGFMAHNFVVGDIVMDYTVDEYDLAAVTSYYGMYELTDADKYIKYDLNRDGNIDIIDVHYVLHTLNN